MNNNIKYLPILGLSLIPAITYAQAPLLSVNFSRGTSTIQAGFDTFDTVDNSAPQSSVFDSTYTVTVAGGSTIGALDGIGNASTNGRDRNAGPADAGGLTNLWQDRFVTNNGTDGTSSGAGNGLYLRVEGLTIGTEYEIQVWGGDFLSGSLLDLDVYGFDATNEGSGLVALGNYSDTTNPTNWTNADDYSIVGSVTAIDNGSGSGMIIYKSVDIIAGGAQGYLNGFTLTTIPEPGSFALLAGALALGSIMTRRRRN